MNAIITNECKPSLFEKRGEKRTTLYLVVSGHTDDKGEPILISRNDVATLMSNLSTAADMVDASSISEALDTRSIPERVMEKLLKQASSGLDMRVQLKAEGETAKDKMSNFLLEAQEVWEEMNAAESSANPTTGLAQFIAGSFTMEQMNAPTFKTEFLAKLDTVLAEAGTLVRTKAKENGLDPKGFVIYRKPRKK